jgi:nucleoid-associated protein YgaU
VTTNGRIPDDALTTIAVGERLLTGAATAYRALVAQAAHEHVAIKLAPGVGSAYRDLDIQKAYWDADHGDKAAQKRTNHTPGKVPVAAPGGSSHGWGDRVDLIFDGSSKPNSVHLNLAKRFGFVREFGSADANHFEHDGHTAIHSASAPTSTGVAYTVKPGDTLSDIAEDYHLSLNGLLALNPQITNPDHIEVGQKVRVR